MTPEQFGAEMAKRLFKIRGGHSEMHLNQAQLADTIAVAYEAGSGILPRWMPLTSEVLEALQPRSICWVRTGHTNRMACFHANSGMFRLLPDGEWATSRDISHVIVLSAPGAPE